MLYYLVLKLFIIWSYLCWHSREVFFTFAYEVRSATRLPTLGRHLFNTSINDLYAKINFSNFVSRNDLRMYHIKKLAEDCKLLQSDVGLVQEQCIENDMKINMHKTSIIYSILCVKPTLFNLITMLMIV
jgi:hypothetical protein